MATGRRDGISVVTAHQLEREQLQREIQAERAAHGASLREIEKLTSQVEAARAQGATLRRAAADALRAQEQAQRTAEALSSELKAAEVQAT